MDTDYIGRPGINTVLEKHKKLTEYFKLEDERMKYWHEAILKFKEFEDEKMLLETTPIKKVDIGATKEVQMALQLA
jgi:hypothetical protein